MNPFVAPAFETRGRPISRTYRDLTGLDALEKPRANIPRDRAPKTMATLTDSEAANVAADLRAYTDDMLDARGDEIAKALGEIERRYDPDIKQLREQVAALNGG